ncbi:MAG: beta-lactamase family protein [Bacillus sp. (in: Bacteria)]|nr:beta-lactamase family protein [Bacillus sp. (in: firmicutes)]
MKQSLEQQIHEYLTGKMNEKLFPGYSCMATKDENLVLKQFGGYAVMDKAQHVSSDTVYDLASVSKIVTTTMILRLITLNKLSLETSINECLPEIQKRKRLLDTIGNITIYQLLTHSSKILAWYPFYTHKGMSFYEILDYLLSSLTLPESELTDGVKYSDLNFMLLGEIIKEVTKTSLSDALKLLITEPLSLRSMQYGPIHTNVAATEFGNQIEQRMVQERGLQFHSWRPDYKPIYGEVNDGNTHYFWEGQAGHAGIFSNIQDIHRIGRLYIEGGGLIGATFISKELIKKSLEKQVGSRGLGWSYSPMFPKGCGHTGFTGPTLWVVPQEKLVVSFLTNRLHVESKPKNINDVRQTLHEKILDFIS